MGWKGEIADQFKLRKILIHHNMKGVFDKANERKRLQTLG